MNSASESEHQEEASAKAPISNQTSPQETPTSSTNPFSQLGMKPSNGTAPRINISPAGGTVTPQKRERGESEPRPSSRAEETLPEWEDRILGGIFRLTLDPNTRHDIHGHSLHFVASVREDMDYEGYPVKFRTSNLDQCILEAASNLGKTTPLDYLLACWKRVTRLSKTFKTRNEDDPNTKYSIVKEAQRMCMSYCIFAVNMPDMFG